MLVLKILKLSLIFGLSFCGANIWAHQTIVGFEDTMNYADKARLKKFTDEHHAIGHHNCYYSHSEDTVICEDHEGTRYYFK